MKTKNRVILLLLFVMSLYISHGLFFTKHHEHEHSVIEYISEFQSPSEHGDECDFHFLVHQLFLLPKPLLVSANLTTANTPNQTEDTYFFKPILEFYKPPIFLS